MSDFKRLAVWQKGHDLALAVHRTAAGMRGSLNASLKNQMVRAAMSIPTNIVEGRGQKSELEFARFLRISLNSTSELEYHLIVARDTRAISGQTYIGLVTQVIEVRRMLHGLLHRIAAARSNVVSTSSPDTD